MLDRLMRREIFFSEAGPVHLRGGQLVVARLLWALIFCATLGLFIAAFPVRFEHLQTTSPLGNEWTAQLAAYEASLLQQMGVPIVAYAVYFVLLDSVFFVAFVLIGLAMVWRKFDQPLALFASLAMITFGSTVPAMLRVLDTPGSIFELPVHAIESFGWGAFFTGFFIFPDGRFAPRVTRFVPIAFIGWAVLSLVVRQANVFNWDLPFAIALFAILFAIGVAAQLYRYLQTSSPTHRQQTKWVVFGFLVATLGISAGVLASFVFPSLLVPSIWHIAYHVIGIPIFAFLVMLIPITIGLSILRYRLWDIDIIIRRTLIYGGLTANLALVYLVSIILLQQAFRIVTPQSSDLAIIISTLAMAALFNPLRARIQNAIDQRFYRNKYDAHKVLEQFAAAVRNEVELERLAQDLVNVVQETMQPTNVILWLKK